MTVESSESGFGREDSPLDPSKSGWDGRDSPSTARQSGWTANSLGLVSWSVLLGGSGLQLCWIGLSEVDQNQG